MEKEALKKSDMVCVEHVSKKFGRETVLKDVSLRVEEGEIVGIVGRNGSGKTVLFKLICGFLTVDEGSITVDGKVLGKDVEVPEEIGSIIETPGFLNRFSGFRNLKFLADIRKKIGKKEILEAMELVGLEGVGRKKVGRYSLGMRQRLGIAQAVMEDQKLLILDEPMNGLDNQGVSDMRELFMKLKNKGKTILIASHNREDIDILCDRVFEMDHGVLTQEKDRNIPHGL